MKHKQQRVNALRLKQLLDNGMSKEGLAKACGVHKNAVTAWLRLDDAPYWTEYVCEALKKKESKNDMVLVVCQIPARFVDTVAAVVKSVGGEALAVTFSHE